MARLTHKYHVAKVGFKDYIENITQNGDGPDQCINENIKVHAATTNPLAPFLARIRTL